MNVNQHALMPVLKHVLKQVLMPVHTKYWFDSIEVQSVTVFARFIEK
jgi:hypothetical protein